MAETILDASRVAACVSEGMAAGITKHVSVDLERQAGALTDPLDQAIDGVGRERAAALGGEHEAAVRELPAQCAQGSHFITMNRMRARLAALCPAHVQRGGAAELFSCDHSRSATSLARRSCRYAIRIRVASRSPWRPPRAVLTSLGPRSRIRKRVARLRRRGRRYYNLDA
jgi:hypothetical protein